MMMTINANTKIAALLKHSPDALEAIVSISPKFTKLRNPILRKVIAGRTSIAMASQLGGCSVGDFFNKLQPLGFDVDQNIDVIENGIEAKPLPAFLQNVLPGNIVELDVRSIIEKGSDPLNMILEAVKSLKQGSVLKIINSFEPTPLMHLLGKQGFESFADPVNHELVYTYFYRLNNPQELINAAPGKVEAEGWEESLSRFAGRLETIDVRALEMPLPMHTILEALAQLPADKALFVRHKRLPVFLLPELDERTFRYRIKQISDAEVQMLIYKD